MNCFFSVHTHSSFLLFRPLNCGGGGRCPGATVAATVAAAVAVALAVALAVGTGNHQGIPHIPNPATGCYRYRPCPPLFFSRPRADRVTAMASPESVT